MMYKTLRNDAERMEEIMEYTQDKFIYWIAVAIYHLIQKVYRLEQKI